MANYLETAKKCLRMFREMEQFNKTRAAKLATAAPQVHSAATARAHAWGMAADAIRDEFEIEEHLLDITPEMEAEAEEMLAETEAAAAPALYQIAMEVLDPPADDLDQVKEDDRFIERQEERRERQEERDERNYFNPDYKG